MFDGMIVGASVANYIRYNFFSCSHRCLWTRLNLPSPHPRKILVIRYFDISYLDVYLFQNIKQILELNRFLKSEFTADKEA